MFHHRCGTVLTLCAIAILTVSCSKKDEEYRTYDSSDVPVTDDHDHGEHGPHAGEIVELDSADGLHAEVVLDEATGKIDLYILGSDAATAAPISAKEVTLSFTHGTEEETFTLTASPLEGEAEGTSSRFSLTSAEAIEELHEHAEGGTLRFELDGKTVQGTFKHEHHDHGDAAKPDHDHAPAATDTPAEKPAEKPAAPEAAPDAAPPAESSDAATEPAQTE